jgi:hypothetical protein
MLAAQHSINQPTGSTHLPSKPSRQQAKCGLNQVVNIEASLLDESSGPQWRCRDCPENSVSNGRGFTCMVCPPGTYADRTLGRCRACYRGYYNSNFGAKFCQPCAAGTFAPFAGSLACIKVGAASSVISCKFDAQSPANQRLQPC